MTVMRDLVIILKKDCASDLSYDLRLLILNLSLTVASLLWNVNDDVLLPYFSKAF